MALRTEAERWKRTKRLGGWQRIGIVASAIWIMGSVTYQLNQRSTDRENLANAAYQLCEGWNHQALLESTEGRHPYRQQDCWAAWRHSYTEVTPIYRDEWIGYLLLSLIPVTLAWLGVYAVCWIVRWIGRGFGAQH